MEDKYPFCSVENTVIKNKRTYVKFDNYPVTNGHLLIIPYRHFSNYFKSSNEEKLDLLDLLDEGKKLLDDQFSPDGYNIGINCGKAAGQTIMHLHIHLIPRYSGEMDDPTGGVRYVIPNKAKYRK